MIQTYRFPQGTRVRVRRGRWPIDLSVLGRTGLVMETDDYRPQRYGVVLDEEDEVREFAEDELEPLTDGKPAERAGNTGPTAAR